MRGSRSAPSASKKVQEFFDARGVRADFYSALGKDGNSIVILDTPGKSLGRVTQQLHRRFSVKEPQVFQHQRKELNG